MCLQAMFKNKGASREWDYTRERHPPSTLGSVLRGATKYREQLLLR